MTGTVIDPRAGAVRGLRALLLAAVAVGVAGAAHSVVDGCVHLSGLVLALGACWPLAVAVLGRRQHVVALVAWVAAAQVVTHAVVELTCGPSNDSTPSRVLLAHAAAVLVTSALLARGDDGLWVAQALRRALRPRLPLTAAAVVPAVRPAARRDAPRPRATWLVPPNARRGPPSAPC